MFIPLWLLLLVFTVVVCMVGVIIEHEEKKRKLQERIQELEDELQTKENPSSELGNALEHAVMNRLDLPKNP
jgi:cell division protein FtsL